MSAWICIPLCLAFSAITPETRDALQESLALPQVTPAEVNEEVGAFVRAKVPPLVLPASREAWDQQRETLREAMLEKVVFRGVPEDWRAPRLRVEWRDTISTGQGYSIQKLLYEALPDLWIPALFYLPDNISGATPAVLNVNGHVGAPGKANEEDQTRSINLAKRGVIAMHPEWFSFGELKGDEYSHNRLAYLDLVGVSGLSVFYLSLQRALDVLEDHPQVDKNRIVVTGLSGGGWQTILISALDPRVAACAPNAGYIGLEVRTHYPGDIGDLEQVPSDLLTAADYTHLTALLAPRPTLLIYNAKDQCCFAADHALPAIYEPLMPWFELYDAAPRFTYHINEDPGTHNYGQDNREAFYAFLKREVMPEAQWDTADLPVDGLLKTPEELEVGLPAGNANFVTLAQQQLAVRQMMALPENPSEEWKRTQRETLAEALAFESFTIVAGEASNAELPGLTVDSRTLRADEKWTVPLKWLRSPESGNAATVIIADEGMPAALDKALELLNTGRQVILVDPIFLGQNKPDGRLYQYPMLINSTGARALGIQAAQIAAAAAWVKNEGALEEVHIHGIGYNAGTASLMAAALAPENIDAVTVEQTPGSFFALIEEMVDYNEKAPLFVFGLLPELDLSLVRALAP